MIDRMAVIGEDFGEPDLLARVREDIDNAKENGYDFFGTTYSVEMTGWDDDFIAGDITACTGGYDDVTYDQLVAAVAAVRKERTT